MPRTRHARLPAAAPPCPVKTDDELVEMWLYGRPETTQRNYRTDVRRLREFAGKPFSEMTLLDFQGLDQAGVKQGRSLATRHRWLSTIHSLFDFALRAGYVSFDASAAFHLPKMENALAERILGIGDVRKLFRVLNRRCRRSVVSGKWHTPAELANGLGLGYQTVVNTARKEKWPYKWEKRNVGGGVRRTNHYKRETVQEWCAPAILKPGWYTVRDLARITHRKSADAVRTVARKRRWPYKVIVGRVDVWRNVKVYPSSCAKKLRRGTIDMRNRALVYMLYFGGFRVSEALSVRWKSFRQVQDGGAFTSVYGKGSKTRSVRIPPQAWRAVKVIRGDAGPEDFVFWGSRSGQPLRRENAFRFLKALAREANVTDRISPHWLRHCHASLALEGGASIRLVQLTLGHASLESTARYLHVNPEDSSGYYLPDPTAKSVGPVVSLRLRGRARRRRRATG